MIALQGTFRALADPTRRDILVMLSREDMTVAGVSEHFEMTRAAVKKHLVVLEEGHLISVRRQGRETINKLRPQALKSAQDWLNHFSDFWDTHLDNLKSAVEAEGDDTK